MTKQLRLVFFALILLVAILAATTTFLAAKTRQLGKSKEPSPATVATNVSGTISPGPSPSTAVKKAASASEKPSHPSKTYTVQKGEMLLGIAQANGLSLTEISAANGIADPDDIQAGQVLIIPEGSKVSFVVDNTQATSLQDQANAGKLTFRLSPEETARSDAPGVFSLEVTDSFVLESQDAGKAVVIATHETQRCRIELGQPVTSGEKGIWAIEQITLL